jgi:Tol biopolymer transport system component
MTSTRRWAAAGLAIALAALAGAAPAQATFPGRNGALAYVSNGSSGDTGPILDVRAIAARAPGSARERLLVECRLTDGQPSSPDCTSATRYDAPSYSPDGRRIVLDTGARLAVMNADGSDLTLLPAATANDGSPAFAPDGERIAFTGVNERGGTDVYVRRLDGGPARAIVYDAADPAWSVRDELAYVREGNVYRADPNGRRRRFVTSGILPDWSPDGRRLVVVRPSPNLTFASITGRLHVVGASGRGLRRIAARDDLSHPVWSPDGRYVAFDGEELGVHVKRVGSRRAAREVAPTQSGDGGGYVVSYNPAWRPR